MTDYTTIPEIVKSEVPLWEQSPVVIDGDLYRLGFARGWVLVSGNAIVVEKYLPAFDGWTKVATLPWTRFLGSAFVDDNRLYVFGSTDTTTSPNKIVRQEIDVTTWAFTGPEIDVRTSSGGYKFYNTSVCNGPDRYIMAYETNEATPFSFRFLQSYDLVTWAPIGGLCNAGFYSACPTVKYAADGYYLVTYLFDLAGDGSGPWITAAARTNDFSTIDNFGGNANYTCYQQFMAPDGPRDGVNTSDIDFIEWEGKVYITYLTGDQNTWGGNNDAWFNGTLEDLYRKFWSV